MLSWVRHAQTTLAVRHGIVRAHEVQCLSDAEEIRRQAQESAALQHQHAVEEAQACLAQAREEAQAMRDAAISEIQAAVQKGYDDGWAQSCAQWHEQQSQQHQTLRSLHAQMADIVVAAVERMVHSEDREALYRRALQSVQAVARDSAVLTMRVSPCDEQAARQALAAVPAVASEGVRVEIQVDTALAADSCIVESDQGWLDASLQTQLAALRAAMERAVRRALTDDMGGDEHAAG